MATDAPDDPLRECFSFVVASDGTCTLNPRAPQAVGTKPWEWCPEPDRERCREAFIQACMFRSESEPFEVRMNVGEHTVPMVFRLFPLDGGEVLCLFTRSFKGELSQRERHVLALVAGGAASPEVARVLGISESTVRDHVANIKRKLHIVHPDGLRLAAHHFGLIGREGEATIPGGYAP